MKRIEDAEITPHLNKVDSEEEPRITVDCGPKFNDDVNEKTRKDNRVIGADPDIIYPHGSREHTMAV